MIFVVRCDPYEHDILFCVGATWPQVARRIRNDVTPDSLVQIREEYLKRHGKSYVGRTWMLEGGMQIIQVPPANNAAKIALLGHEVLHAVVFVLRRCGIQFNDQTEEAYCYLHQHVMTQALRRIAKKHWK